MQEEKANEIASGFNAMGQAFRQAGKNRIYEEASKNGYVSFRRPEAVEAFQNNPEYINWTCEEINGEFRFYPPKMTPAKSGNRRVDELVERQGYVQFTKPEAIEVFRNLPGCSEWKCVKVDEEFRFYPPMEEEKKARTM